MPSPEQTRRLRIDELFSEFKGKDITLIDPIFHRVFEKWPSVSRRTAREYAISVLRMLKAEAKKNERTRT